MDVLKYLVKRAFESVPDVKMEKIAYNLLKPHWETFSQLPASRTGKYHPRASNVIPYGLVNHTIRVIHFAEHMCDEECIQGIDRMEIMMACLFHDIGKVTGQLNGHADWGADYLDKEGLKEEVTDMVRYHMSHWQDFDKWDEAVEGGKWTLGCQIVAHADYLASMKHIILTNERFFLPRGGKTLHINELEFLGYF